MKTSKPRLSAKTILAGKADWALIPEERRETLRSLSVQFSHCGQRFKIDLAALADEIEENFVIDKPEKSRNGRHDRIHP